jgi:hypothetical protein
MQRAHAILFYIDISVLLNEGLDYVRNPLLSSSKLFPMFLGVRAFLWDQFFNNQRFELFECRDYASMAIRVFLVDWIT